MEARARHLAVCLGVLAAVSAAGADPALASSARVTHQQSCEVHTGCFDVVTLNVAGGPGEANRFVVAPSDAGHLVVRDDGAPISAGTECQQLSASSVRCTSGSVSVDAGDRADRVDTTAISAQVNALGGAGDDVMAAGTGHENYLAGGPGRDDLVGGPHTDSLHGGDGPDRISAGAGADNISGDDTVPSPDVIDGGAGADSFRGDHLIPSLALDIDLRRLTPNGAPGDGDTIRSVEDLWGSKQADRLTGTDGPNNIIGDEGADIVLGLGGRDDLSGGLLLDGGSGNDRLSFATRNRCGPGRDTVDSPGRPGERLPIVSADCERVEGGDAFERIRLLLRRRRLRGRLLRYRGDCALIYGPRCRTTITGRTARSLRRLKHSAPVVARVTVRRKEGKNVRLSLRLNRRGRRALRRGRRWLRFDFDQRGRSGQDHDAFAMFVRRRFH